MARDTESLEQRIEQLENEVRDLKGEQPESTEDHVKRMQEAERHDNPFPSRWEADLAEQHKEEDRAAKVIRKYGGTPEKYNLGHLENACRELGWVDQKVQGRLEDFVKRERQEQHAD